MNFKVSKTRLLHLMVATIVAAGAFATAANAGVPVPMQGDARFQIGNGLPIPITPQPAPHGRVSAAPLGLPSASVSPQITGPANLTLAKGALKAAKVAINLGVFTANPKVFQVKTNLFVSFPKSVRVFKAGGRSGAPTVTYCPGDGVATAPTSTWNPGCPGGFPSGGSIPGGMRYTALTTRLQGNSQFGAAAQGFISGTADVAVAVGLPAPCSGSGCVAAMALASPQTTGAQGAPFGFVTGTVGNAPNPGVLVVTVPKSTGSITNVAVTLPTAGVPNPATSFGGPWTTGMLTLSQTKNAGPQPEVFTITGSDTRTPGGLGNISMVSGAISARTLTGPNANRGWLNLCLGTDNICNPPLPSANAPGFAALIALMMLGGGYALRRQFAGDKA